MRRGHSELGLDCFEQKLRLEEGIQLPVDRLLPIAMRELHATQEEFRSVAGRLNGGDPIEAWRKTKEKHPAPGTLIATAREQLDELRTFLTRTAVVGFPEGDEVSVGTTPEFFRWSFASMWTPGSVRDSRVARDVLPDRRRPVLAGATPDSSTCATSTCRRSGPSRCTRCIPATISTTSTCASVASKVRRSTLFAPASYVEGWAHYCEQMMLEAGFGRGDKALKLGQLGEALVRLARFVVGIRLHTDDWSVEQGVRFFREEAFLEEASARREAERGTFDPTYLRLLGRQADAAQAAARLAGRAARQATCGLSTTRSSSHGSAPFASLRRLMLDHVTGDVLE